MNEPQRWDNDHADSMEGPLAPASDGQESPEIATTPEPSSWWRGPIQAIRALIETVIPALVIAIGINLFLAQATQVQGQSMEPNLHTAQRLVVEKITYHFHGPRRGDIVVIDLPEAGPELLIKRVIALPGETISSQGGQVYVNGELLEEPYVTNPGGRDIAEKTIPPLHVFVMGDNRQFSNDSRNFGPVPIDSVIGRAWFSYWPLELLGPVD
jgi:signal peptidase I